MSDFSLNKGSVDAIIEKLKIIIERPFIINGVTKCFGGRVLKCEDNTFGILILFKCLNGHIMHWGKDDIFKFNGGNVTITEFKDGSVKRIMFSQTQLNIQEVADLCKYLVLNKKMQIY